jgi:uncharacterized protein (DUF924 family)
MSIYERMFLMLPLMHAESKEVSETSMLWQKRQFDFAELHYPENTEFNKKEGWSFAVKHKEIIDQFGRYPYRNEVLERETTEEEAKFLKEDGTSFGQ